MDRIASHNKESGEEIWQGSHETQAWINSRNTKIHSMRVTNEEDKLPAKEHATYESGAGTLF